MTLKRHKRNLASRTRRMIMVAAALSDIFMPHYLPLVGIGVLFLFSYLSIMPLLYKAVVLFIVYVLTILIPDVLIRIYSRYMGMHLFHLLQRERRVIPYIISLGSYALCYYWMNLLHIPHLISSVVMAALAVEVVCAVINHWTKISTHTAAMGGVVGALNAFALIFMFNPIWWTCLAILVAGLVGSSRMLLRQHTLAQVINGFLVGMTTAFLIVIIM